MNKFLGKFRGKVENPLDPQQLGRIQVSVPAVLGDGSLSWAMPSAPYAGPGVGLFLVPPRGANVSVEFEGGDPDYPIWSGCFWDSGDVPASPPLPTTKILKTDTATLKIDDTPGAGGITIETAGSKVTLSAKAIEISTSAGTVSIQGTKVTVNGGALEVT